VRASVGDAYECEQLALPGHQVPQLFKIIFLRL